jgi:Leucine-rich repeat (LRR) protein
MQRLILRNGRFLELHKHVELETRLSVTELDLSSPFALGSKADLESALIVSLHGHQDLEKALSFVKAFSNLKSLCLRDAELEHIPDSLYLSTQLLSLDFSMNKMARIDNRICAFVQLQTLLLRNNLLTLLPDSFRLLHNLAVLDLSDNHLGSEESSMLLLADQLTSCKHLRVVRLARNGLRSLCAVPVLCARHQSAWPGCCMLQIAHGTRSCREPAQHNHNRRSIEPQPVATARSFKQSPWRSMALR